MKKKEFGIIKFKSIMLAVAIEFLVNGILRTADTSITGYIVGMTGLSALNIFLPWMLVTNFLGAFFGSGAAIIYSRYMGEFKKERAEEVFTLGTVICAVCGILVFLVALFLMDLFLNFMGCSGALKEMLLNYRNFYIPCFFLLPINRFFTNIVYSDGGEFTVVVASITESAGNIVLSIPLGLMMGIGGIALGTSISMSAALIILCSHFVRKGMHPFHKIRLNRKDLAEISLYGVPEASMYFSLMLLSIPMDKFVSTYFGEAYLPMLSVLFSLIEFSLVFESAGEALRPIVPVYLGDGNIPALLKLLRYGLKSSVTLGAVTSMIYLFGASFITRIYNITEPDLQGVCLTGIRIFSLSCIPMAVEGFLDSYYLYAEKVGLSLCSYFLKYFICDILLSIPLSLVFGKNGLWLGYALAPFLSLFLLLTVTRFTHRGESLPYLVSDNGNSWDCTTEVNAAGIGNAMEKAEAFLKKKNIDDKRVRNAILNLEETLGLLMEKNPGKTVLAECFLKTHADNMELIIWDNGIVFDTTKETKVFSGFRSYTYPILMKRNKGQEYLVTVGFNRIRITF
ncbi:MAG: hypothetical protein IJU87_09560 [Lachnospiraceae bacterium]|nr:hypothetical protein [Lachnospiraceae bacterium]